MRKAGLTTRSLLPTVEAEELLPFERLSKIEAVHSNPDEAVLPFEAAMDVEALTWLAVIIVCVTCSTQQLKL